MNCKQDTSFSLRCIITLTKIALSFFILLLLYWTTLATIGRTSLISKDISNDLIDRFHGKNFILITDYRIDDFQHYLEPDKVFDLVSVLNLAKPEYFQYALDFLENKYKIPVVIVTNQEYLINKEVPALKKLDFAFDTISLRRCYIYKNEYSDIH